MHGFSKEVRKEMTKEKKGAEGKVINMPAGGRREYTEEEKEKGRKAARTEKGKAYQKAINEEREMQQDNDQRESQNTGGSSGSNSEATTNQPMAQESGHTDEREEEEVSGEGGAPIAMAVPESPSNHEREEHELTHIPYRSWCEHCVKGRARSRAHKRRNQEIKKEELKKATRIYMDFYYNGIEEEEEEREETEGVRDDDEGKDGDSPSIIMYDSQYKPVASWVMQSKRVGEGGGSKSVDPEDPGKGA